MSELWAEGHNQTAVTPPAGEHFNEAAKAAPASSASGGRGPRWGVLRALTRGSRTNADMLWFRTLNRDMRRPNANGDFLAPLLRDHLTPLRSRWFRVAPGARASFRAALEHPRLGAPGVVNFVDARTKWMDEAVSMAVAGGMEQVVVVAAGFDTRAYRLGASAAAQGRKVAFWEVDLPAAAAKKRKLIAELLAPGAYPRPTYVAADLAVQPLMAALVAAGFDAARPALFTLEGLVYYLPQHAVEALLGGIAATAAPGSRLKFDFLALDVLEGRREAWAYKVTARSVANKGEPFLSGIGDSAAGVHAFFDGPIAAAAAREAAVGTSKRRLELLEFLDAKALAAHHLPHLKWPAPGSKAPPPMLSFYAFASAQVACF